MSGRDLEGRLADTPGQRHRGRTSLAMAATVAVVTTVGLVFALTRGSGNGRSASNAVGVSPTITAGGKSLRYAGEEAWQDPVLDETDPDSVYVYASQEGGTASWGGYCWAVPVARIVSQTATAVSVAVARYSEAPAQATLGSGLACTDEARGPLRLTVTLSQPLGARSLIDAHDGAARRVLDPATVLKPSHLPDGYTGGQATWEPPDSRSTGVALRTYEGSGGSLLITVGPASLNRPMARIIERTSVRGHPATVSDDRGFEQDILVAWNEDSTSAVTVYGISAYDKAHPSLTAPQLVRIANSLR